MQRKKYFKPLYYGLAVIVSLYALYQIRIESLKKDAIQYADNVVTTYFTNWDPTYLYKNLDANYQLPEYLDQIKSGFEKIHLKIGSFEKYFGSTGTFEWGKREEGYPYDEAHLHGKIRFSVCDADLDIQLIHRQSQWRIEKLMVEDIYDCEP